MITLTEEQFKEMIEAAHRAGQHNQGHCDPSAYEAMVYYECEVKKLIISDVMSCSCDNGIIVCPGCNGEQSKFGICAGCKGTGIRTCGKCGGKNKI